MSSNASHEVQCFTGLGNIGDVPVEDEEEQARNAKYEADIDAKYTAADAKAPHSGGRGGQSASSLDM